ncbi:MAG: ectoine hydrolase DoeA, partial [Actinomycetota bacterium]|nr:ectoine hydrolase DoeA [Actinomycetota bacterium]
MPDVELPFSRGEYADRLSKVRAAMDNGGLEVLVAADPSNMSWLTGYDGWSFYTPQAVIVTHDGEPWWWGRRMDANGARRTVYMDEARILDYSDDHVMSTQRHAFGQLAGLLDGMGYGSARVGVELDNYYYSAAAHQHLCAGLPDAEMVDATALVNWQRGVKSDQELEYMRRAARIVERMHTRIRDVIEPGMRKCDLVAEIYATGVSGTEEFGGDYPAFVPMMPTGADASAPHLTWDDKPLKVGEGTFFEIAGAYRRYQLPLCRTTFLGTPPDDMRRAEKAVLDGLDAGLAAARAGNRANDVATDFYATMEAAGFHKEGRCGYPIGISYPPDWGERTISFRTTDETVLQPGMTFHFMPGLWMDTWGLEITESIVITEDGPAEPLADVPRAI